MAEFGWWVKALLPHWWALMSCAVFTLIGLAVLAFNKSNKWALYASFAAAAVLLLFASFLAWRDARGDADGYKEALSHKQKELDELSKPQLVGEMISIDVGTPDPNMKLRNYDVPVENLAVVLIWAGIRNLGADSIADNFTLAVSLNDGSVLHGRFMHIPPSVNFSGMGLTMSAADAGSLPEKTAEKPIVRGARVVGLLLFIVNRESHPMEQLHRAGVVYDVSFRDVQNQECHLRGTLPERTTKSPGYIPGAPLIKKQ